MINNTQQQGDYMYKLTVEIFLAGTYEYNNLSLEQLNKKLLILS